ncbi:MAG: hypothetical protein ABJA74_08560 [Lapillicoccus sp.]
MTEGFIRPEAKILPQESLVPAESLVQPPPNRFTHETVARTPFSYAGSRSSKSDSDGSLAARTKVVLLRADNGDWASVVDGSGLYVVVPRASLRLLGDAKA